MNPPWLSRLAAAVLALALAACATTPQTSAGNRAAAPRSPAAPAMTSKAAPQPSAAQSTSPPSRIVTAADCIQGGAQKWGIPADYMTRQSTADGGIVLALVNPHSGKRGLSIELTPDGRHTEANLDENGTVVSAQWRGLVSRCADGA